MQTNLIFLQELFFQPVRYQVPEFQRRYVRKEGRQWEPLWADVIDIAEKNFQNRFTEDKYFFEQLYSNRKQQLEIWLVELLLMDNKGLPHSN